MDRFSRWATIFLLGIWSAGCGPTTFVVGAAPGDQQLRTTVVRSDGRWFARVRSHSTSMDRVVEMLGIGDLLNRYPGALSGGEKQRVAIGRALLSEPEMVIADEPLAALDEERKAEVLPYFERLGDEVSVPVLYVSHSAAEVAR